MQDNKNSNPEISNAAKDAVSSSLTSNSNSSSSKSQAFLMNFPDIIGLADFLCSFVKSSWFIF